MTTSDNQLAIRAARGDAVAFESLVERHYDLFYRVAFRLCANVHDAQDIAHDICMALPAKLKSYDGRARFSTWAYKVALNAARDFLRRRKAADRAHATWGELAVMELATQIENRQASRWLYEALDTLGEVLRETAILVVAEGLSHKEAAEVMNTREATISWRMHEVRRKLKEIAGQDNA